MKMYSPVEGSRGPAPRFAITVGLREGYGTLAKKHQVEEVVELILGHLKYSAAAGLPYLTGSVTTGEVVYAWPAGLGLAGGDSEPQATYSGNIIPLYNASMDRASIEAFLEQLAKILGEALGQTRVYIEFDGDMWILQAVGKETPTGE